MNRTESVGVNESVSVGVARSLSVGVSDSTSVGVSQSTSVGKSQSNSVGKMRTETIGLLHMQNVGLMHMQSTGMVGTSSVGLYRSDSAGMNWSQSAGEKMTLTVGDTYSVKCGASSLIMKSDGTITLTGTEVTVNGGGSASTWNANCIGHVTTGQWIEFAASHSMVGPASKGEREPTRTAGAAVARCAQRNPRTAKVLAAASLSRRAPNASRTPTSRCPPPCR